MQPNFKHLFNLTVQNYNIFSNPANILEKKLKNLNKSKLYLKICTL